MPAKAASKAPAKARTKAPAKAPSKVTKAPVKARTKAPVKAPAKAPAKARTLDEIITEFGLIKDIIYTPFQPEQKRVRLKRPLLARTLRPKITKPRSFSKITCIALLL
jgi:hypothetical protein